MSLITVNQVNWKILGKITRSTVNGAGTSAGSETASGVKKERNNFIQIHKINT